MADITQIAANGINYNIKDATARADVATANGNISNLADDVDTAEGNISALQGQMTTANGKITTLEGKMTTAEGNISSLQTRTSALEANVSETIPNGANLNNYVNVGKYGIIQNSVAASLYNCPSSYAGLLIVWNANGTSATSPTTWYYVAQEYSDINGNVWRRVGGTGSTTTVTWEAWKTYG